MTAPRPATPFRLCATALAILSSLGALAAQNKEFGDTVLRKTGGHTTSCKIVGLAVDKVTYQKSGGKPTDIPASQVVGLRFGDAPPEFASAESAERRGDLIGASKLFSEAAKKATRDLVKHAATFHAGACLSRAATKDSTQANSAIAALEAYLSAEANGYFVPEAKVRLAQARLANGDSAGAEAMIAPLEGEATTAGWALRWNALLKATKAAAQFAQGKFADARASYQGVALSVDAALGQEPLHAAELNPLKTEALVMQGESFISEKLYDDALNYYRGLASTNARGIRAAALAGQGQILFLKASTNNDVGTLRQAQLELARAAIEPDSNPTSSAKALYFTAKVLKALGDNEKNGAARAKTYLQSVRAQYATTPWANLARKELDG